MLSIIETILADLEAVTDHELNLATRLQDAQESDDKVLGVLHNIEARRMVALAARYKHQSKLFSLKAVAEAKSEAEEKELVLQSDWSDTLSELAREILWGQVRSDIGGDAHSARHLRIRDGWMVVESPCSCEAEGPLVIDIPIGTGTPSLDGLLRALRASLAQKAADKPKPEGNQPD